MLQRTIKLECKKALCNKLFLFALLAGCLITFFSLVPMLQSYSRDMEGHRRIIAEFGPRNPLMQIETLFNHWIGGDAHTLGSSAYFFLFPLLISIPYGWSYCAERRGGYVKNMAVRCGKTRYYLSKYIALFLSGGLAMAIPMLFNFLLTAMFVPAVKPDPSYLTAYGIGASSLLSMLFYAHPFCYVFLYIFIDFIFCGLIACLCFALAAFVKHPALVTLLPFFLLLCFHHFCYSSLYTSVKVIYTELSPMAFLRPGPVSYDTSPPVLLVWGLALFLFTFFITVVRGRRHDIY